MFLPEHAPIRDALRTFEGAVEHGVPSGMALVVDGDHKLLGTVTDGDVRRALLRSSSLDTPVSEAMRKNPIAFPNTMSHQDIIKALPKELERRGRRGRFLGKIILVDEQHRPTRVLEFHELWEQRVATHRHVAILGLGYVGLTLALRLAESGFRVTGVDVDPEKIAMLGRGESYVHEVGLPELLREQLGSCFFPSTTVPDDGDVFVIAVGTPVGAHAPGVAPEPQLTMLEDAATRVAERLTPGGLVVLRSTVPIGVTREFVTPILERVSGLRAGSEFHVAFAPERTVEGKALQELRELPQIIGGINEDSVEATVALFRELTPTIVRVESLEAAEMAKLINNSYRDVIFSFANEMARIAAGFNLDVGEVIRAANHGYPRDPVPLPSPGVGGPCLTKDPYILGSAARRAGLETTLSHHGRRVNEAMHEFVADAVVRELERAGKDPKTASVLVCGLAFKGVPETGDLRNSSAVEIAKLLAERVGRVLGHDPVASAAAIREMGIEPTELPGGFRDVDAALFLNNHPWYRKLDGFQMIRALKSPAIVYDAWRLFRADDLLRTCDSVYLGLGFARRSSDRPE
ncbi:nucleotide sugar dehydrogenase [Myxococcota bacterium]|nr:nucleotide sugar dehydrogenase [Myxococcota bacterium]